MKVSCIEYSETHCFSPAILRYLERDPRLNEFQSFQPTIDGFRERLKTKKSACNRLLLSEVITEQYSRSKDLVNASVHRNINLLSRDTTFTVTTGHQLNLFTGPLYFIFKIVTTINLARELKEQFPDKDFVPVYWMATEDHDFAEINHTYIAGKKISWEMEAAGATGRLSTDSVRAAVREYVSTLGISANAARLAGMVEQAYLEHSSLADATRFLVNALFENYGLVILDADDARLKAEFSKIIAGDITGQHSFRNISDSSRELREMGIDTPVNPREINFFYLGSGLRERLVYENGFYSVLNTDIRFTEQELREEITKHPENFSPNVVMRPLYQEVILPNLAYIGGGAEIVYWLQLKKNFDFYGVDFPVLLLRNSAMVDSNNLTSKLERLKLDLKYIFTPAEELKKEWVNNHTGHTLNLEDEWQELSSVFEKIRLRTLKIDPTLGPSAEAVKARLYKAMNNFELKLMKAEKRNFAEALSQIDAIKADLFPNGGLQERTENFGLHYVKYGDRFIEMLTEKFDPLGLKFTILEE